MHQKRKPKAFNPCAGAKLEQGAKMAAIMQVVFTFAYVLHGGFLCISGGRYNLIYGMLYIVSGISFFSLAYLLYTTVDQPSMSCFRWWIISSSLTQITVIIATIGRNVIEERLIWSINVWMFCGLFIQCYLTWIVLAYMKYGDDEDEDDEEENDWKPIVKPDPKPTVLPPPAASTSPPASSPPENEADNDNDDNDQNDKDTVIIESADETEVERSEIIAKTINEVEPGTEAKSPETEVEPKIESQKNHDPKVEPEMATTVEGVSSVTVTSPNTVPSSSTAPEPEPEVGVTTSTGTSSVDPPGDQGGTAV